jgi:hypothetical protein
MSAGCSSSGALQRTSHTVVSRRLSLSHLPVPKPSASLTSSPFILYGSGQIFVMFSRSSVPIYDQLRLWRFSKEAILALPNGLSHLSLRTSDRCFSLSLSTILFTMAKRRIITEFRNVSRIINHWINNPRNETFQKDPQLSMNHIPKYTV